MYTPSPIPQLPTRIDNLYEFANNLYWSWYPPARDLFRILDHPLWKACGHNPVKMLRDIAPDKLEAASKDNDFLALYDHVMSAFESNVVNDYSWFAANHRNLISGPIAYFCMEFAIHNSLPIYAGGLGVLAGDICKEASDLGIPLVGVGFMYPQGYFHQHISADGWQEEFYRQLSFDEAPITQILSTGGKKVLAEIMLNNRVVHIGAWKIQVGRTPVYLLDTDVEENTLEDRELSARLYTADRELRIEQEILLGIGGVRVLRALSIRPDIWHANEGHAAFMMLERMREKIEKGTPFTEALKNIQATTVFTTHTPVPAGHDVFPVQLIDKYFRNYWDLMKIDRETFLKLGQPENPEDRGFNMSVLALNTANHRNAVSKLHGEVARKMWHDMWPDRQEDSVPIIHVTNGVHVPTWIAPELLNLYQKHIDQSWIRKHDDHRLWDRIYNIPDEELWSVHQLLKRKLIGAMIRRARNNWYEGNATPQQVLMTGALLDPDTLTLGFVRRFAAYKRPMLIFQNIELLKQIINDTRKHVQIIFAGKSHPADMESKNILHRVYNLAMERDFQGRIAFVEDYDIHIAHFLTQGVDVWLNNPRRLHEACGTSGMKAALNGVPHLSILDGWWYEGYNGADGWAIGNNFKPENMEEDDQLDADSLYRLLQDEVIPLYYDQDRNGIPHRWVRMVKESIHSTMTGFTARRMLKEYTDKLYIPAARARD